MKNKFIKIIYFIFYLVSEKSKSRRVFAPVFAC